MAKKVAELPDIRAMTLKALMKAGGVDYLVRQAEENPQPFLALLGRIVPRELHTELSGEVRVRQEVRRDLVEKVLVLMQSSPTEQPLPALTHAPETMLKASALPEIDGMSRSQEFARRDGHALASGVQMRAATMHAERLSPMPEAANAADMSAAQDGADSVLSTQKDSAPEAAPPADMRPYPSAA